MKLSIVIVSWNTADILAQCLDSVFDNPPDDAFDVWVVDNASSDGTSERLRRDYPQVQLVTNTVNAGFATANNQAMRLSRGDYILLLNPDTIIHGAALQTLVNFLDENPAAGACGARLLNGDGSLQHSCYVAPTLEREMMRMFHLDNLVRYDMDTWDQTQDRAVEVLLGACILGRRDLLQRIGLMDESYFMYSEEVDLCYRIAQAGWEIYWVPAAEIVHLGGQSTRQVRTEMFLRLYEGKLLYMRKHYGPLRTGAYKFVLLIASMARLLLAPIAWFEKTPRREEHLALAGRYWQLVKACLDTKLMNRILYLSQLIPYPADAGPKVRTYHVLQYLAAAGHEVTLVAFQRESDKPAQIDHMRQYCAEVHTVMMHRSRVKDMWYLGTSLLRRRPFLIERDTVAQMHQLVRTLITQSDFDAVHADQLWMAQYALTAQKTDPELTTVLDQHNAVYLVPERLADSSGNPVMRSILKQESHNMARFEVDICQRFNEVVWVTAEDRAAVAAAANGAAAAITGPVIPICVDPKAKPKVARQATARRVTFLGGLHWPPNASGISWFAREVWPHVVAQQPDAIFTVIGKDPPEELTRLGLRNLEVTGYVTDVTPYLEETAVFIVPLHAGGGMRVKIVDGWSWGLPIISTTIGAEGIGYHDGEDILIADSAKAFATATVKLLSQPEMGTTLGANGRKTLEAHYDWRKIYPEWDDIYK